MREPAGKTVVDDLVASTMAFQLIEHPDRFELRCDGDLLSWASFSTEGSNLVVPHVETAVEHRGNGHADRLMTMLLDELAASGRTITPLCGFAASHIRSRPERMPLLG